MRTLLFLLMLTTLPVAFAGGIFKKSVAMDYDSAYKKVYNALEENRFYVIEEINVGKSIARFKDKWKDFNLNQLERQQVMIVCNGWYANQVGNADTDMLALCPLRVTLIYRDGVTTALFARPTVFAADSKALPILKEVEETIVSAISSALE